MDNPFGQIKPLVVRTPEQNAILRKVALSRGLPETIYEDFFVFVKYMVPKIKVNKGWYDLEWFHKYICDNYQEAIFGTGTLLSIEIGPQIGKSIITSLFIIFVFGVSPDTSIIYTTYNETLAILFTKRYVVKFMTSDKYRLIFPHIALKYELDKKDSSSEGAIQRKISTMKDTEFTLSNLDTKENYNGGYRCYGIAQGIHGVPADIFIIDDYVDNADSVRSENFRASRREWFYNDMPSRLQDNSSIVIAICTRWYEEDIIGMLHSAYDNDIVPDLLAEGITPPKLNKIRIRAHYRLSDDNPECDPRTKQGEILWRIHTLKISMAKHGEYFEAVHNCDPMSTSAKQQIKESDFGYYEDEDLPKAGGNIHICMDGASTANKKSDHTAIGAWLVYGRKRYLLKLWHVKLEVPALVNLMIDILTNEFPHYHKCLIEFANSGVSVSQFLKDKGLRSIIQLGFNGKELNDNKKTIKSKKDVGSKSNSKMDRYLRTLPEFQYQEKRIFLMANPTPEQFILQKEFIRQMCKFTGDPHAADDFVDMGTYLINYTTNSVIVASKIYFSGNRAPTKQQKESVMCYNLQNPQFFIGR